MQEIALEMVGRKLAMKKLLVGGRSLRNASQLLMASGLGSLVLGLLLELFGVALGLKRKWDFWFFGSILMLRSAAAVAVLVFSAFSKVHSCQ